jgi:hypothetical protein
LRLRVWLRWLGKPPASIELRLDSAPVLHPLIRMDGVNKPIKRAVCLCFIFTPVIIDPQLELIGVFVLYEPVFNLVLRLDHVPLLLGIMPEPGLQLHPDRFTDLVVLLGDRLPFDFLGGFRLLSFLSRGFG